MSAVPLLIVITMIVFALAEVIPGDPAAIIAGQNASPEVIEAVREERGLDRPVYQRYATWMWGVLGGDLGQSVHADYPVTEAVFSRLPVTLGLTLGAMAVACAIGIPAGVAAGRRGGSLIDRTVISLTSIGLATPNFWLGIMLILGFALALDWLPAGGYAAISVAPGEWLRHMILPAMTLGVAGAAEVARQMRASLIDTLNRDFITALRARGLSGWSILFKHGLKNALIPVVTVLGLMLPRLFGLAIIVERVFDLPGVGTLVWQAVFTHNLPIIQGVVLVVGALVVFTTMVVDILYGYLNPKVRSA